MRLLYKGMILGVMFSLCLGIGISRAAIIEIGIEAEIVGIDNPELFGGSLGVGDVLTGSYIYDSEGEDIAAIESATVYEFYSEPYGIRLSSEGFVFQTDPDNAYFKIGVSDGTFGYDSFWWISYSNLPLSNGVEVYEIFWQLDDDSGTALSSAEIPLGSPILGDWDHPLQLMIDLGPKGSDGGIFAEVTSVWLIPEPSSVLLLGLGFAAFVRRRRR